MDAFYLHIFAFITMLIDHIGYRIFPKYIVFRIIGRLAFPIFAFFIAEGIKKTKNIKKYVLRIFICCFISEIPYNLFIAKKFIDFGHDSVMVTYLIAILGILAIEKYKTIGASKKSNILFFLTITIICFLIGKFLSVDYSGYGILTVFVFYFIDQEKEYGKLLQLSLFALIISIGFSYFTHNIFGVKIQIEFFSLLSFPLIWSYKGKQGIRNRFTKILFYGFYPIHLAILALIGGW